MNTSNRHRIHLGLKRSLDIIVSISALIILSPLLILIAVIIKLDSPGPVLFRQGRLTKDGKEFPMLKFRSMVQNAEKMGTGLFNFANDPRITRVGNFLRKTSLDELPQFLNVLFGDMSLVGPRPPVTYELGNYENLNATFKKRFTVNAGITGLAQVSGRNEIPWDEKVAFDNQYIDLFQKHGIFLDLKILIKTAIQVFIKKKSDIYEIKDPSLEGLSEEEIARLANEAVIAKATKKEEKNGSQ